MDDYEYKQNNKGGKIKYMKALNIKYYKKPKKFMLFLIIL